MSSQDSFSMLGVSSTKNIIITNNIVQPKALKFAFASQNTSGKD